MNNDLNYIDIEIDKLTRSIENAVTGDIFDTELILLSSIDKKQIKKSHWLFDWHSQLELNDRQVYKLVIKGNPDIIQGLLCLSDRGDHIYMNLIESAKFNRGKDKIYLGVPGNLVAFTCKLSFEKGYDGFIAFDAKTALIKHYEETIFATHFKGTRMFIETTSAMKLVNQYFQKDK
ncbi:MAG: hypothetical protein WCR42_14390 [bacterium]